MIENSGPIRKRIIVAAIVLALALLSAACNGEERTVAPDPTAAPTQPPGEVDDVELPVEPTPPEPTGEVDEGLADAAAPTAVAPEASAVASVEPTATPEPTTTTAAVVVNGLYEQTFFRGRADAPVTIIDYSDFL